MGPTTDRAKKTLVALAIAGAATVLAITPAAADLHAGSTPTLQSAAASPLGGAADHTTGADDHHVS
ncbi:MULTISPECIES: hypothetical protein [Streptomyces]|uniref:hypothetical protein n=1 Tax=Streptomyces TaxID=1883 RepID=UPI00163C1D34|nr:MULTISPECIES: hypothetical protein [Streptomyces]MBC2875969.1 hypothetical protein [Streptomyces sp. TYQ1024]UBI38337.1 hypothetical protein K7I03_18980 [Streptomyces mobaraensis]UKW30921.1 hypothetical protein MCU78_18935 [Streptomyces sp. TYQ1024]